MKILFVLTTLCFSFSALAVPTEGHHLMIAAPSPRAVETGQKIIKAGGNVVDVAVAVELTLAVTSPYYASLGGGGFSLIRMKNEDPVALDFREMAPALTNPDFYLNKKDTASTVGGTASGVPGIAAGLWAIHQKYGKLPWKKLFAEPIRLAEEGFPVSGDWVRITGEHQKNFNPAAQKFFFNKGETYRPGDVLKQPQLAKALKLLRDQGSKGFYGGDVARDVVQTLKQSEGVVTLQDMQNYKVRWLKPLQRGFMGYTVYMMPPPSSSGVVTMGLMSLAEKLKLSQLAPTSTEEYHMLGEILKAGFRGRSLLGDPDFNQNPIDYLTGDEYIKSMADRISSRKPVTFTPLGEGDGKPEHKDTTNFTVMDADGNTVVMTVTLNGSWGSGVSTNKYGIAMNNEMDDFATQLNKPNQFGLIQGRANSVQAGKRPLSSMSPTIITKDGKTVMGVGGSGGPRIISSVFQVWYRVLVNKYDIDRALQVPRVHEQFLPDTLYLDDRRFSIDTQRNLDKMGHKTQMSWMGCVTGIVLDDKGWLEAGFDNRVEGGAGGE